MKTQFHLLKTIKRVALSSLLILAGSCGEGSSVGNPFSVITLKWGSHSVAHFSPLDLIIPKAYATLTQANLCFKRLRFKIAHTDVPADPTNSEDNVDFNIGEITLDGSGAATELGTIQVPTRTYVRLEFDLEDGCGTGYSVRVDNDVLGAAVQTNDRITIKFTGVFNAADTVLTLSTQNLVDAIKNYNGAGNGLKNALESVSGSF